MKKEFEKFPGPESIKDENDFLKMKMMLERGAVIGSINSEELSPEIENQFLKNIMAFEQQSDENRVIRVFDKIERPAYFKPAAAIPDDQIENAWDELLQYLQKYFISLDVCSPNISVRELYRFTIEELFEYEMDDINVLGMTHCFTYDEFHPDQVYENIIAARDECMQYVLEKLPMEWMHHFKKEDLRLNDHTSLTGEEFKIIVNMFKMAYDDLEIRELIETDCIMEENISCVSGTYNLLAHVGKETCTLSGKWKVYFEKDEEIGYWYINNVQVEGINF